MKKNIILPLILFSAFIFNSNIIGANLFISDSGKVSKNLSTEEYQKHLKSLDKFYSAKKLGSSVEPGKTIFRLFAPQAKQVVLFTFNNVNEAEGKQRQMEKDIDGVWFVSLEGEHPGLFYGYKVINEEADKNSDVLCIDPYSRAVASYNEYFTPRKSIVIKDDNYDWEGDSWIKRDWRDAIIYEMHIKDQTAHPSSGAKRPGTYMGLTEKGIKGGLDYIKALGVNTVELLPAQEFANIEIPYKDSLRGRYNNWNPYERNHWGYMTAAFFAPEAYYSHSDKKIEMFNWQGEDARQIKDFKDMVKALHKEGIAVMMDVVYNHISDFEIGNLKEIDKEYYFRLNERGNFLSESGCGNDLKTERPMVRRMIVESVLYWMKEYHIDGFRFDLAKLIDWETAETILREAKKINPDVIIIAEPWGGGYDPAGFSLRGWAAWNDQIRNGIKGQNPNNGLGWIFGSWYAENNPARIRSFVKGTPAADAAGIFQRKEHSVNYLESHDDNTMGDFIRIATRETAPDAVIKDVDANARISQKQMKLNKLAAAFLYTAQGMLMIHAGQEFARSKVISFNTAAPDTNKGRIDHNSYNKDNETNYINYKHAELNRELVDYYKGLAAIRNKYDAFKKASADEIKFFDIPENQFALAYQIKHAGSEFLALFNAGQEKTFEFKLPAGEWEALADPNKAGLSPLSVIKEKIPVQPVSAFILMKK